MPLASSVAYGQGWELRVEVGVVERESEWETGRKRGRA